MDRTQVDAWVAGYVEAWRTAGTEPLGALFDDDIAYLPSPWATPIVGLEALGPWWDHERNGPDEVFTFEHEVVAVAGDVAVVRVAVDYGDPITSRWKDLWILRFADDGRCESFEEWPFSPRQPDGH